MLKCVVSLLKLHLFNISDRIDLSLKYIKGNGLEIGAMHFPLPVAPDVCVRYVDVHSRLENIARYPEIDCAKVVETDFVEDGFKLASFEDGCVDFVIANHVLEHTDNPLGTLRNWSRVLKGEGILFVSVPNYLKCFDRGRKLTALEHLIKDYNDATTAPELVKQRNLHHYREWVEISLPAARSTNKTIELPENYKKDAWIENMVAKGEEIHFHTFNYSLFNSMLVNFCSEIDSSLKLIKIYNSSQYFELIAILQKSFIA